MATMSNIEVSRELRPCLVYGNKKGATEPNKALFHLWEQSTRSLLASGISGGVESTVFGIVELEGGTVMRVAPYQIQFVDNKIHEYSFNYPYFFDGSSPEKECINKEIPLKPEVMKAEKDTMVGNVKFGAGCTLYKCQCGCNLFLSRTAKYCPQSGQKIDWEV